MKKNSTSPKLLILLGLLVVFAAYFYGIHTPISKQTQEYNSSISSLESEIAMYQSEIVERKAMKQEIEDTLANDPNRQPLVAYSNVNNVIQELNAILAPASDYVVSFGDDSFDGNICRREVTISYTVADYDTAVYMLNQMKSSTNRYLIENLSIQDQTSSTSNGGYVVNVIMRCFEYVGDTSAIAVTTDTTTQE